MQVKIKKGLPKLNAIPKSQNTTKKKFMQEIQILIFSIDI